MIGVAIETTVVKPGQIQTVTSCDSHILPWLPRSCNIKAETVTTGYTRIQHLKESLLVLQEFLILGQAFDAGPIIWITSLQPNSFGAFCFILITTILCFNTWKKKLAKAVHAYKSLQWFGLLTAFKNTKHLKAVVIILRVINGE